MNHMITDTTEMLHNITFLKKVITIALPVAMQGMLNTVVNLVDNLMIGSLGSTAIASVGLANKVFFVFTLLESSKGSGDDQLCGDHGDHCV